MEELVQHLKLAVHEQGGDGIHAEPDGRREETRFTIRKITLKNGFDHIGKFDPYPG